jgi:hypothetical protein
MALPFYLAKYLRKVRGLVVVPDDQCKGTPLEDHALVFDSTRIHDVNAACWIGGIV